MMSRGGTNRKASAHPSVLVASAWLALLIAVLGLQVRATLGGSSARARLGDPVLPGGRGVGSAVVGGLSDVLTMGGALLLLSALPVLGILALAPQLRRGQVADLVE
jgi:hypothetical protein